MTSAFQTVRTTVYSVVLTGLHNHDPWPAAPPQLFIIAGYVRSALLGNACVDRSKTRQVIGEIKKETRLF